MGGERRSAVITEEDRRNTAFHEAGHALTALCTPGSRPIHKATIIPRGSALGMVRGCQWSWLYLVVMCLSLGL